MGLLDSTIRTLAGNAANFLMLDMTLTQKSDGSYTVGSGYSGIVTSTYACRGYVDEAAKVWMDRGLVQDADRVVILLQTKVETGTSDATSSTRLLEDSETRLLESGDSRLIEGSGATVTLSAIEPGDTILARGTSSIIKSVAQDPAQATWILGVTP